MKVTKSLTIFLVIAATLTTAGCHMSIEDTKLKKQECETAGGVFSHKNHEFGTSWYCDLNTKENCDE